jgi:hypothetical protein
MITTRLTPRHSAVTLAPAALACAVALFGCGMEGDDGTEADVTTVTSAAFSIGIHGIDCGIMYENNSQLIVDGACDNVRTRGYNPPPGWPYELQAIGDRGLRSGAGFWAQSWRVNNVLDPQHLVLPRGTACGFKESGNNAAENCMGEDPKIRCPAGWNRRFASDLNAPSGTQFFWCEYRDDNQMCPGGNCLANMPKGLACGIADSDTDNGVCLSNQTVSMGCPAGFLFRGFYDWGRPWGHGVGWCEKQ